MQKTSNIGQSPTIPVIAKTAKTTDGPRSHGYGKRKDLKVDANGLTSSESASWYQNSVLEQLNQLTNLRTDQDLLDIRNKAQARVQERLQKSKNGASEVVTKSVTFAEKKSDLESKTTSISDDVLNVPNPRKSLSTRLQESLQKQSNAVAIEKAVLKPVLPTIASLAQVDDVSKIDSEKAPSDKAPSEKVPSDVDYSTSDGSSPVSSSGSSNQETVQPVAKISVAAMQVPVVQQPVLQAPNNLQQWFVTYRYPVVVKPAVAPQVIYVQPQARAPQLYMRPSIHQQVYPSYPMQMQRVGGYYVR